MQSIKIFFLTMPLVLGLCFNSCNQHKDNKYAATIKSQAEIMEDLFLHQKYIEYSQWINPKIVKSMGGAEKIDSFLKVRDEELKQANASFVSIKVDEPSDIISVGNQLQCTISVKVSVRVSNTIKVLPSIFVATSDDDGKRWFFIDATKNSIARLQQVLPNLSDKLNVGH